MGNPNPEVVKLLITAGAAINEQDWSGRTPLIYAAAYNTLAMTELLLDTGADAKLKDDEGKTAYDYAVITIPSTRALNRLLEATK